MKGLMKGAMEGMGTERIARLMMLLLVALSAQSIALEHDTSDAPLFVVEGVDPNIVVTVDDSGSMGQSNLPDSIVSLYNTNRVLSSSVNKIYYNPDITYLPPVNASGVSLGNADFNDAWSDGYDQVNTCRVNLATSFQPTWDLGNNCDSVNTNNGSFYGPELIGTAQAAYYYQFDASNSGCSNDVNDDDCYDKVVVSANSAPTDVDGFTNFANWYSYYRKRIYLAKAATSLGMLDFGSEVRVGYQSINDSGNTGLVGVNPFVGTDRSSFYSWLFDLSPSGGTPLRQSLAAAGEYYSTAPPYRDDPGDSSGEELSCRQNFHILMTDGYWNGSASVSGNRDNQTHTLPTQSEYPTITSYSPRAPYQDNNSAYLADHAFYYWVRDLRTTLENNVPTSIPDTSTDIDGNGTVNDSDEFWNPANNPASWQHMVNFTIGLGVEGQLDIPDDYAGLLDGTKSWSTDEIDDLWHTAINSRGRYLSAQDSQALVDSFREIISRITETTGSYAPVALNTGTISSNSAVFFAQFETNSWIGHLISRPISNGANCGPVPFGELCPVEQGWDAACTLTGGLCTSIGGSTVSGLSPDNRTILTMNPDSTLATGIPFRWNQMTSSQQDILRDADGNALPTGWTADNYGERRLSYLRGNREFEIARGGPFRNRQSILGDIISSTPLYVGRPNRFYPGADIPELSSYGAFRTDQKDREPVVYVGANDGMLHGFKASDGYEVLAYIPDEVFSRIGRLSFPDYSHTNYVDGPLSENDVYFDASWHTVLVGGLGLGGQGYFALDITDPDNFSEANASSLVLWEFTDDDDADMGYSYGRPSIVRLNNGSWVAIFGNGVNATEADGIQSTTGNAVVYIVDIKTGALIKKLDTGVGSADDPEGLNRPNGIIGIFSADLEDDDFIVDRLYATDMFGNVWAFDLSGNNPSQWKSAYGSTNNPAPLYTAVRNGQNQPITSPPVVIEHPHVSGAMVLFGTGQYLGVSDITNTRTQSYYGIYDNLNSEAGSGTSRLIEQTITFENAPGSLDARTVSDHGIIKWDDGQSPQEADEKLGWYIDLPESGERVFQRSFVRQNRLIFRTATPSSDRCSAGGTSWLMEVDPVDGSRLNFAVFDYTRDGLFNSDDQVGSASLYGSGIRDGDGIDSEPGIIQHPSGQQEVKVYTSSDGSVDTLDENNNLNRRTPWRQIR